MFRALSQPFATLTRSIELVGFVNTIVYEVGRALARLSGDRVQLFKYDFVAQPVAARPLTPDGKGRNLELRWITAFDPAAAGPRPLPIVEERFRDGAVCLLAEVNGLFAAFLWLQLSAYADDEVRCVYRPVPTGRTAWDYDVYIDPRHRLGFAFTRLWDETNVFLRGKGVEHTFSRISAFNPQSRAAHARLGSRRVGGALFVTGFGTQLMLSTLSPRFHLSRPHQSPPVIELAAPAS